MKPAFLRVLSSALLLALLFAAALPVSAFADDGTPPPTEEPAPPDDGSDPAAEEAAPSEEVSPEAVEEAAPSEEVASEPVEEAAPSEEVASDSAEEAAPSEEIAPEAVEESAPSEEVAPVVTTEEAAPSETAAEPEIVEEPAAIEAVEVSGSLLSELPADTTLVVLDAQGEPLPLASEEAADVLATGDPKWCPTGVTPGGAGCSGPFGSLSDLVDGFVPTGNGVIWIQAGTDSGGDVEINGTGNWASAGNFSLTLKGGWSGANNTTTDPTTPSEFDTYIHIINWSNDVTLSDIVVSGVSGSSSDGLIIYNTGKITLTRVDVVDNEGTGATLGNTFGTSKDVTVSDGEFSNNEGGVGLYVASTGVVTLTDVTANSNGSWGAWLENTGGLAKGVNLKGTNVFGENDNTGLVVRSNGAITISTLIANSNWGGHGADLDNSTALTAQPVTFTKPSEFKFNGEAGLLVYSRGNITANSISANNNFDSRGAFLDNRAFDGFVYTGTGNITLNGTNTFNENGAQGLVALSRGTITLSNVTAKWNGFSLASGPADDGVVLLNVYATSAKTVTLTGVNLFEGNEDDGLEIQSLGAINVANLTSNDNGWWGAYLYNMESATPQAVTISGKAEFQRNDDSGLEIYSKGNITVNNIYSNENGNYGALLDNDAGNGTVTVNGTATFTTTGGGFFTNAYSGLEVYSNGIVNLKDLDFGDNGGYGLLVDNDSSITSASVTVGTTLVPYCSGAWDNDFSGMEIYSKGVVTMNRVCNWENGWYGALVDNSTASGPKAVTFTGMARFRDNGLDGLHVVSTGAITTMNLTGTGNGWSTAGVDINLAYVDGFGVYLDNRELGDTMPQNVTLNGFVDVWDNYYSGIEVWTYGAITANNVYAENNGWGEVDDGDKYGYGARFDNDDGTQSKLVTLNGTNEFFSNWNGGLLVDSLGAIKVNNLDAWSNDDFGASLWNGDGTGGITVSGHGWVSENGGFGLYAGSKGPIALANADAWNNGGIGVALGNYFSGSGSPQNVTLTGTNYFSDNWSPGLTIWSYGAITLNNINAYNNGWGDGSDGVYLDNCNFDLGACTTIVAKPITITGTNTFNDNAWRGLFAQSIGSIAVNNVTANNNEDSGVELDNAWDGAVGGVTVNGTNGFDDNGGDGLKVYSYGAIKANNLSAWGNGGDGAHLDNDWLGSTIGATVILTGSNDFGNNGGDGLYIESWRAITISNIYSDGNGGYGAWIDNTDSGTAIPQNVTITGTNEFYGNQFDGLWVTSYGVISVSNITANDNGQYNYWADAQIPPEPLIDEGRGVYLNNCGFDWSLGVQDCSLAEMPKAITLTGVNTFNGNFFEGLVAVSLGAINGNSVTANWNGSQGAYLDNQWDQLFAGGTVKLTGTNRFEGNDGDGLQAYSHGTITLNNVTSNWNTGDGTQLNNWSTTGPQVNVVLTGTNTFNGNGDWSFPDESWGLKVFSEGNITANNLNANWNDYGGAYLNNVAYSDFTPLVTLTGANNFLGNQYDGLVINATGSVSLSKVTADGNGDDGVYVFSELGNVVISCGSMTSNGWTTSAGTGLDVQTATGTITLKGVYALGNWWNTQLISPFTPIIQRSC